MNKNKFPTLRDGFLSNEPYITCAMKEAVYDALREHKRAGNPVAVWQAARS